MRCRAEIFLLILGFCGLVMGVKKQDFKRCDQSGFCYRSRLRALNAAKGFATPAWAVNEKSIVFKAKTGEVSFALQKDQIVLGAKLRWLEDGRTLRLQVDEEGGSRYKIPEGEVISKDLVGAEDVWIEQRPECPSKRVYSGANLLVHLDLNPFKLTVLQDDEQVIVLNGKGLFNVESEPISKIEDDVEGGPEEHEQLSSDTNGEEDVQLYDYQDEKQFGAPTRRPPRPPAGNTDTHWGSNVDSMPKGRQSLSMDIMFNTQYIYGLPEHTTGLNLVSTLRLVPFQDHYNLTTLDEPYRLYNLDVFEYEIDSTMALYGAVPFVLGGKRGSVGAFWNNPSETWVDVVEAADENGRCAVFTSESGVIDLFLVVADPTKETTMSKQVLTRYAEITGFPTMPPQFALGYHQCRWNYKSQVDLLAVHSNFDTHQIPVDVLWLDIEHTDGKRYFTWDRRLFPEPEEMQRILESHGRHLVNIVDPHIKSDDKYRVYKELKDKNLAVLSAGKKMFHGHCWPGTSCVSYRFGYQLCRRLGVD
jgi:alpha 1,3-glucosidase